MNGVIGTLIGIMVGAGFTAGLSYSNLNPTQFNQATELCSTNGGVGSVRSNMWNDRTVICVNGATFENFGEKQ
ncbi:hypothetical protein D3C71_1836130 [compost metagenome]